MKFSSSSRISKNFSLDTFFYVFGCVCKLRITEGSRKIPKGSTSGAGTAEHFQSTWDHPVFSGVRVTRSFALCMFCRCCPFVIFLLAIVLSVLRFTDSDYPFGIFKTHESSESLSKQYKIRGTSLKQTDINHYRRQFRKARRKHRGNGVKD